MNPRKFPVELNFIDYPIISTIEDFYIRGVAHLDGNRTINILKRQGNQYLEIPGKYNVSKSHSIISVSQKNNVFKSSSFSKIKPCFIMIHRDGSQKILHGDPGEANLLVFQLEGAKYNHNECYIIKTIGTTPDGSAPTVCKIDVRNSKVIYNEPAPKWYRDVIEHAELGLAFPDGASAKDSLTKVHSIWCLKYGTHYYISTICLGDFYTEWEKAFYQINIFDENGRIFRMFSIHAPVHSMIFICEIAIYGRFVYIFVKGFITTPETPLERYLQIYCVDMIDKMPTSVFHYWKQDVFPLAKKVEFPEKLIEEDDSGKPVGNNKYISDNNINVYYADELKTLDYYDFDLINIERNVQLPEVIKREARLLFLCCKERFPWVLREVIHRIVYYLI